MFIGSKSTSTVLDVFKIGLNELTREVGLPEELHYRTRDCEIAARGADLSKRVDVVRIAFQVKPDSDTARVTGAIEATKLGARVQVNNGTCAITLPSFEWRQLPRLKPIDAVIEEFASHSLRSQSWEVEVVKHKSYDVNINRMIEEMQSRRASDLHLRAGSAPYIRIDNELMPVDMPPLTAADIEDIVHQLGSESEVEKLRAERETSFQFHAAGVGYLRVSGYFKHGAMALAIRLIPENPLDFEQLGIPPTVRDIASAHRGLLLVCGITGCGKSTTLAAMVKHINDTRHTHIITVEDPIEYVYRDNKSIISQRQVGRDTFSFANALRGALREDPDVIMVGEMRDVETIRAAISAAETGHLVFSTLHTMTAVDTVNRVISFFPPAERDVIRQQLAYTLRGIVCQRLLKRKGRAVSRVSRFCSAGGLSCGTPFSRGKSASCMTSSRSTVT